MTYISEHKYKETVKAFFNGSPFPEVEDLFLHEVLYYCYRLDKDDLQMDKEDLRMTGKINISKRFRYGLIHDFIVSQFGDNAKLGFKYAAQELAKLFYETPIEGNEKLLDGDGGKYVGILAGLMVSNPLGKYLLVDEVLKEFDENPELKVYLRHLSNKSKSNSKGTDEKPNGHKNSAIQTDMASVANDAHKAEIKEGFKKYTDFLAETLTKKNLAYGNSFDDDMEKWGYANIGIRLHDKYGRIEQLIKNQKTTENDESILDNLLDIAGYSILGIKNLIEKKNLKGLKGFNEED